MNTLLLSLTKSGTNFAARLLSGTLGLDGNNTLSITPDHEVGKGMACDYCALHVTQPFPDDLFDAIIVPLRHPYDILISLRKVDETSDVHNLAAHWEVLVKEVARFEKVMFLTINGSEENRVTQVEAIRDHFGSARDVTKFVTEWKPAHTNSRSAPPPEIAIEDAAILAPAVEVYNKWQQ